MKNIYTLSFILFSFVAVAQDYQLFNADSKKVFMTSDIYASSYSLAFDSVSVSPSGEMYFPYKKLAFWLGGVQSECIVWSGECYERNSPGWMGNYILHNQDDQYMFLNYAGDTLLFDFTLAPIESHTFYQDSIQRFSISQAAIPMDTIQFGNVVDSVRIFHVSHTDLQGNFINSPLNNFEIIIGKQLGLINFFSIHDFPMVLTPLYLMGNSNPAAGIYQLTNEIVYDYQAGDEFQYFEYYYSWPPTPFDYRRYTKLTCLERNETADSLKYLFRRESFKIDSTLVTYDTITTNYLRNGIIAQIPFDFLNDSLYYTTLFTENQIIDENIWTYTAMSQPAYTLCPYDGLWCYFEYDYFETVDYSIGLGQTGYSWESVHLYPYMGSELVYYKKNGTSHGQEMIVGVKDPLIDDMTLVIPNPAHNQFRVTGSYTGNATLYILDTKGKILMTVSNYKKGEEVDIAGLEPGLYIITLVDNRDTYSTKLIVQ